MNKIHPGGGGDSKRLDLSKRSGQGFNGVRDEGTRVCAMFHLAVSVCGSGS